MSPMIRCETKESDFSSWTEYTNDFLEEIEFNPDVDSSIRSDIEFKFRRSTINPIYMFPRVDELESVRKSESVPRGRGIKRENNE